MKKLMKLSVTAHIFSFTESNWFVLCYHLTWIFPHFAGDADSDNSSSLVQLESDSESRIEGDVVVDSDNDKGDRHDKPIDEQDELKYWIKVYLKHYHYQPELLSEHNCIAYLLSPNPSIIECAKNNQDP